MRPVETQRPSIRIFVCENHGRDAVLAQLKYGIEEEGVPYEITVSGASDAVSLGWEAARQSRLEVGVGLDKDGVALHFAKLDADAPLFQLSTRAPMEDIRALGANAARLVKKLPFKKPERLPRR